MRESEWTRSLGPRALATIRAAAEDEPSGEAMARMRETLAGLGASAAASGGDGAAPSEPPTPTPTTIGAAKAVAAIVGVGLGLAVVVGLGLREPRLRTVGSAAKEPAPSTEARVEPDVPSTDDREGPGLPVEPAHESLGVAPSPSIVSAPAARAQDAAGRPTVRAGVAGRDDGAADDGDAATEVVRNGSWLGMELRLLQRLRSAPPREALDLADEHTRRFGAHSSFEAERELYRIRALRALGEEDRASRAIERFLSRHGGSPYAVEVRALRAPD